MNFAFITFKYYPFGGLEKSLRNIALEVARRGHAVTLYCYDWRGDALPGVAVEILPAAGVTNHGRMASFVRQVRRCLAGRRHDLVVGFKCMPGLDLFYDGDVCYRHAMRSGRSRLVRLTPRYRTLAAFEEAVFSVASSTHVMYIAEREKSLFQACYGTAEARFHPLPPGIDKARIRAACSRDGRMAVRADLGAGEDALVLLMVGSDFRRKGVDRTLRAMAALPDGTRSATQLWVVGKGDAAPHARLADRLGLGRQARFLGPRDDVPALLAAADMLLHPALSETAGNAILEGLVAGLPVIVSESAGFSIHVARSGGGLVVPDLPWRQARLDQALARLATDEELRRRLGGQGWHYADITDLYRRPRVAADIMEQLAKEKADADMAVG
jgi:UDP-glucose:(heptosyl)LPS alpha-1,3-glucosyltransferase